MNTPAPTPIENLWTVQQARAFLNVSRTFIYEHCARGDLPHVRLGGHIRFEPDEVRAWVKKNRSTAPSATVLPIGGRR